MRRPMATARVLMRVVGLMLLCSHVACRSRPVVPLPVPFTAHRSPHLDQFPVRRVLMMPVANYCPFPAAGARVEEILAARLQASRLFELVRLSPRERSTLPLEIELRDGTYSETQLIELRERLRVDAVLFVTVSDLVPYWPQRIGCRGALVDTRSGEVVASFDGVWDGEDADVRRQAFAYFGQLSDAETLGDPEMMHQSATLWTRFVADQIVLALSHGASLQPSHQIPVARPGTRQPVSYQMDHRNTPTKL